MSAVPVACGSVTGSPAAAPSISTSCSEPEPTLSLGALWAASEEQELYFYHCTFLKPSWSINLTTGLELNCYCNCIRILCTDNKRSFILNENDTMQCGRRNFVLLFTIFLAVKKQL